MSVEVAYFAVQLFTCLLYALSFVRQVLGSVGIDTNYFTFWSRFLSFCQTIKYFS